MQNGNKYVPPHLRKSQSSGGGSGSFGNNSNTRNNGNGSGGGGDDYHRRSSYSNSDRRGSYNSRGSFDSGKRYPRNGSFSQQQSNQQQDYRQPATNSRWNNMMDNDGGGGGPNGGGGGGGNRRSSYQGYSRRDSSARMNERGYHGDMRPDKRVEKQLFDQDGRQTTGINFDNYDKIPIETSGDDIPDPIDTYSPDTIGEDLHRNTQLCGYSKPTPVQKYSVPIGSAGRDLMACAQTGSGKTAGFLFPIIMSMISKGGIGAGTTQRRVLPEALVLAPTRELASQIQQEARRFTYCTGIASVVVYGGADVREQLRHISMGCDLLVATPGRLVDLIERGRLAMDHVRFLVLDEADRMLDMGFEPQIRRIVEEEGMPQGEDRQTMMFSATFPANIQRLASDFLNNYIFLTVGRVGSACKDVTQTVEYVENGDKMDILMKFLCTVEEGLILIFVETKRSCDYVEDVLCHRGFPACSIHGDKGQREREDALRSFKRGDTPVMVATDVASRGLDIPNVTQVVNYDLPTNIDDYVHRIGRTGRAGNTGAALSFVNEKNGSVVSELRDLLEENEQEVPSWLNQMCAYAGGRRKYRGNNNFGGRDVRHYDSGNRNRGGGGGGYHGGGGGGGYHGGGGGGYQGGGGGYGGGGYHGGGGGYGGGFGGGDGAW